jgi:DNA-binding protein HU-beta
MVQKLLRRLRAVAFSRGHFGKEEETMAGRKEMTEYVATQVEGISRKQASDAVDCVFKFLTDCLARGERIQVPGFGTFNLSERAARQGRNPTTGATIDIAASKNVRFKAGKDLRDQLNR